MDVRPAVASDLTEIVRLLADDPLGAKRERLETPLHPAYVEAFAAIARRDGDSLLVAVEGKTIVGCLQVTVIPGLDHWAVLRGDAARIRINKLDETGSKVELIVPYHRRRLINADSKMESNRETT